MSSGNYQVTYISEQERQRRLEAERQRREEERKKKEAERQRQLEEQKRWQLEAEQKKRAQDLMQQQQKRAELEKSLDSRSERDRAHLNSRLIKIQATIDSRSIDPSEKLQLSNEINQLHDEILTAKESHLKKIVDKIDGLENRSQQLKRKQFAHLDQKSTISKPEVLEKLRSLKKTIAAFDAHLIELVQQRIEKITHTVNQIEGKLIGNFDFYYAMLKNLESELYEAKQEAERKFQEIEIQKYRVQEQISLLLARLDIIVEKSNFDSQRQQAIALRNSLTDVLHQNKLSVLIDGYDQFQSQVQDLENEFENYAARESDRRFILQQTTEVLKEMGYEVLHEPYLPDNNPASAMSINFKAPAGQGVRISASLNQSLHGQFCRLVPQENPQGAKSDEPKLLSQCQSWCNDYIKLVDLMKARGIDLKRHWHFDADLAQIDKIEVPAALLKEIEEQISEEELRRQYHSSDDLQRRTNQ